MNASVAPPVSMPASMPGPMPLPWGRRHLLMLVALNVVGAGLILLAWYWSAGSADPQNAPLNLAVIAMVVAGGTNAGWLMRGRRAIGVRRRAWLADLTGGSGTGGAGPRGHRPVRVAVAEPSAPTPDGAPDDVVLVVRTEGALRFHRPGCPLIADRPVDATARRAATSAGRLSCGACRA